MIVAVFTQIFQYGRAEEHVTYMHIEILFTKAHNIPRDKK